MDTCEPDHGVCRQNEAGKSNLFEAPYCLNLIDDAAYDLDEEWPVDQWEGRKDAKSTTVCRDRVYLWPAHGAAKTPMYAGFAIGQDWDPGVLLDSDEAGHKAKIKIDELYVSKLAEEKAQAVPHDHAG